MSLYTRLVHNAATEPNDHDARDLFYPSYQMQYLVPICLVSHKGCASTVSAFETAAPCRAGWVHQPNPPHPATGAQVPMIALTAWNQLGILWMAPDNALSLCCAPSTMNCSSRSALSPIALPTKTSIQSDRCCLSLPCPSAYRNVCYQSQAHQQRATRRPNRYPMLITQVVEGLLGGSKKSSSKSRNSPSQEGC